VTNVSLPHWVMLHDEGIGSSSVGCLVVPMWLAGAGTVDLVAFGVLVSRWGSLVSRCFCCLNMDLELGFITRDRDELNVLGAVGSGMVADVCADCCVLLLIGCGQFWEQSMLPWVAGAMSVVMWR